MCHNYILRQSGSGSGVSGVRNMKVSYRHFGDCDENAMLIKAL